MLLGLIKFAAVLGSEESCVLLIREIRTSINNTRPVSGRRQAREVRALLSAQDFSTFNIIL